MKEIKFRFWYKGGAAGDKMVYWHPGQTKEERIDFEVYMAHGGAMQFTGIRDRNDKEIYSGDIIKIIIDGDEDLILIREIVWVEGLGCWNLFTHLLNNHMFNSSPREALMFEVIGNIFETPDLVPKIKNV